MFSRKKSDRSKSKKKSKSVSNERLSSITKSSKLFNEDKEKIDNFVKYIMKNYDLDDSDRQNIIAYSKIYTNKMKY